jgi:hypothetical protein
MLGDSEIRAKVTLAGGAGMIGLATWLVLAGRLRLGGVAAAFAGVLLLAASVMASDAESPVLQFVDSAMDRAFDGCLFTAVALSVRHQDEAAAAVALGGLVAAFIAAYIRARGRALGYAVEQSPGVRLLRYGFVAGGLLGRWLLGGMIGALAVVVLSAVAQARQVASQDSGR